MEENSVTLAVSTVKEVMLGKYLFATEESLV